LEYLSMVFSTSGMVRVLVNYLDRVRTDVLLTSNEEVAIRYLSFHKFVRW
jgi:hypothetical protein